MNKMLLTVLIIIVIILISIFCYFFVGNAPQQKNITWGVNFSQMQAQTLQLDWKTTYLAMIQDLGVKNIKLLTQWDFVEGTPPSPEDLPADQQQHNYYFDDIDWQIQQAQAYNVNIVYVIGLKTGRWPECHAPGWANDLSEADEQNELLSYMQAVINRYKDSKAIVAWQVENEPLFDFGQCPPWYYQNTDFLKKEVTLVKSLDPSRPVIVSDSGEQSFWLKAANIGDIVGTTMYRKLWVNVFNWFGFYATFPFPPVFYYRKAQIVQYLFHKVVICVELQAEPWAPKPFNNVSLAEQEKSMNLQQFKDNISYAKQTGLPEFYFWGVEWWYWLKVKENQPQIWDTARELFKNGSY